MTNVLAPTIKRILKIIFIFFLILLALSIFVIFLKFSEVEKRLSSKDGGVDYSNLLSPDYQNTDTKNAAPLNPNPGLNTEENSTSTLIMGDGSNYWLGGGNPKITIVEFADFSCPYCKKSFSKIREISLKYNSDVKYIFRDLPIVSSFSPDLALAARCAGEQGLFWMMHDRLFMDQGIKEKAEIFLSAQKSGVEMKKFEACYTAQKYLPQIKKDYSDAQELKIDKLGTPIWFINGTQVAGDIPEATFAKIIESILEGK